MDVYSTRNGFRILILRDASALANAEASRIGVMESWIDGSTFYHP